MKSKSHRHTTEKAIEMLEFFRKSTMLGHPFIKGIISEASPDTDSFLDVEFIDVWFGKDDPHDDELDAVDDEARYKTSIFDKTFNHTGHNHFIDIRKGPGIFDDYDGYSYRRGSGVVDMREPISELIEDGIMDIDNDWLRNVLSELFEEVEDIMDIPLEAVINYYLNDEYVHAPGHKWYRNCSPPLEHYSFYEDRRGTKKFNTKEAELKARFPTSLNVGTKGRGIPYSVFMPVDNLARYWYYYFNSTNIPSALGPILHAVQDATVPHHAAATNGSWHKRWEATQNDYIEDWVTRDKEFQKRALVYIREWLRDDPEPPQTMTPQDKEGLVPAKNWEIDQLVTWLAFHAYDEFANTYNHFRDYKSRDDFEIDIDGLKELTIKAVAMSTLVLIKMYDENNLTPYVGNKRTKELHKPECAWVKLMKEKNRYGPMALKQALTWGWNGCHHCLPSFDTG